MTRCFKKRMAEETSSVIEAWKEFGGLKEKPPSKETWARYVSVGLLYKRMVERRYAHSRDWWVNSLLLDLRSLSLTEEREDRAQKKR